MAGANITPCEVRERPGHASFDLDVGTVRKIGRGAAHMGGVGPDRGWGLGRHVLGTNDFHHVRDPWGSHAEYSCDIDHIPAGHDWPAADRHSGDSLHLRGPPPPEEFITNYEVENA